MRWATALMLGLLLCSAAAQKAAAAPILTTPGPPFATGETPESVAFSPDGRRLATANAADDSV